MPSIPTVPGSEMVSTPGAAVKTSFDALNQPNRAAMQYAGAIEDVGYQVSRFAQQLQEAKNFGLTADADRTMRQATADFQASRVGRTDEDQWGQEWKDRAAAVQDEIMNRPGTGPALRRQLTNNLKNWNQANAIEVQTIARKQSINRVVERASGAAQAAAEDGGPGSEEAISAALDPLVSIGAAYPEKVANMKKDMFQKLDYNRANNFIMNNPPGAVKALQDEDSPAFKNLTPQARKILINQAKVATSRYQGENLDKFKEAVDGGIVLSEDELKEMLATEQFSQRQVVGYRAYIKQRQGLSKIEDMPANAHAVQVMVDSIPSGLDDSQRLKYVVDIQASPEYNHLSDSLRTNFNNQIKQDAMPLRPEVAMRHQLDDEDREKNLAFLPLGVGTDAVTHRVRNAISDALSLAGLPGMLSKKADEPGKPAPFTGTFAELRKMPSDELEKKFGEGANIRAILDQEEQAWTTYKVGMRAYERANPKATDEDLRKESQRLKRPYVMASVAASLAPAPASEFTKGQRVKQNGTTYMFDGNAWKEVK